MFIGSADDFGIESLYLAILGTTPSQEFYFTCFLFWVSFLFDFSQEDSFDFKSVRSNILEAFVKDKKYVQSVFISSLFLHQIYFFGSLYTIPKHS